jgi:hypothetical protein
MDEYSFGVKLKLTLGNDQEDQDYMLFFMLNI